MALSKGIFLDGLIDNRSKKTGVTEERISMIDESKKKAGLPKRGGLAYLLRKVIS